MPKKTLSLLLIILIALLISPQFSFAEPQSDTPASLLFIENAGQFDPRAQYLAQADGNTLWVTADGLWLTHQTTTAPDHHRSPAPAGLSIPRSETPSPRGVNLHLRFPGSSANPVIQPLAPQHPIITYFTADGTYTPPVWGGLRYINLYPGLDLEITSRHGSLHLNLIPTSATAPANIPLQIDGADSLRLENGLPILITSLGDIPLSLTSPTSLTLQLSSPQTTLSLPLPPSAFRPHPSSLILPPSSLPNRIYSTYLGGNADDQPNTLAVDNAGAVYVAGETYSLPFPSAPGEFVPEHLIAAFIAKVNPSGTALDYIFNIISAGLTENSIQDIQLDGLGNAYVTGFTDSADFPTTPGAYDVIPPAMTNLYKAFVMKINPSGNAALYSTLLGTNTASEAAYGLALDGGGNAVITGYTESATFPTTPGAFDQTLSGTRDVFVTKLNATGTALIYSTLIGGTSKETGEDIFLDAAGNIYIAGYSEDGSTYPHLAAPIGPLGYWDVFVTKLNHAATGLLYSTVLGGSSFDFGQGLAVDTMGFAYVTGAAYSADFPTTAGAFAPGFNGGQNDGFVFKLNPDGAALAYSTYLGGDGAGPYEWGVGIDLDSLNRPWVIGSTGSDNFPTTPDAFDTTLGGEADFFITQLNETGSALTYSTLYGGDTLDYGAAMDVKGYGKFAVTGSTDSPNFPTTPGAYDPTPNGGSDVGLIYFETLLNRLYLPIAIR